MKDINDVGLYFTSSQFLASVVVVCITMILLVIIKKYLIKKVAYTTKKDEQHQNTFIGVVFNLLQYLVILGCVVIVLQLHGVNVTSIVAGLGIVATLVGLALQDTMKDVISGINIYNNNFYKVGDMVNYNGTPCEVKYFSARVTKFKSMYTGNTFTVCNSNINAIEKIKDSCLVLMTFDMEDDKETVDTCFKNAIEKCKDVNFIKKIDYYGLSDLNQEGLIYIANINSGHKFLQAKAAFTQALYEEFIEHDIAPSFQDEHKIRNIDKK